MFQAKEQRPMRKCRKFPPKIKDKALQIQQPTKYLEHTFVCLSIDIATVPGQHLGAFQTRVLDTIIGQMKNRVKTMESHQRNVAIMLDEMAVKHVGYNPTFDCVDGLTGKGPMADNTMVIEA
ncbi:hypothetical protein AALO_G00220470 [Alosa alosa]|uniref:Transposase n=1 Tax=Alosa alosa TaxID=278164 RepID=A0AAV6FY05_9TELE|nr:hypothetical protein AALO_G00220470 [Alosa alosa]